VGRATRIPAAATTLDWDLPALCFPKAPPGSALSETSTDLETSFALLGLTPGAYVYSWGAGADADTFTIDIGVSPVPEPSTSAMMLIGLVGLGYAALRRKGRRSGSRASQPSGAPFPGNVAEIG
jgi:PEP-CTERM motif